MIPSPFPKVPMRRSILLVLFLAACSTRSEPVPNPPAEPPAESPALQEEVIETPSTLAFLVEGEGLLAEGRVEDAIEAFQSHLAFDSPDEERARALWGMTLAHLVPDGENYDPERAFRNLASLADEYPETIQGRHARWLQDLMEDAAETRALAAQQAETIEQLTEMVEQLRRIDLQRRPPPDSIRR